MHNYLSRSVPCLLLLFVVVVVVVVLFLLFVAVVVVLLLLCLLLFLLLLFVTLLLLLLLLVFVIVVVVLLHFFFFFFVFFFFFFVFFLFAKDHTSGWLVKMKEVVFPKLSFGSVGTSCIAGCLSAIQLWIDLGAMDTTGGHAPLFAIQFSSCSVWSRPAQACCVWKFRWLWLVLGLKRMACSRLLRWWWLLSFEGRPVSGVDGGMLYLVKIRPRDTFRRWLRPWKLISVSVSFTVSMFYLFIFISFLLLLLLLLLLFLLLLLLLLLFLLLLLLS